MSEPDSGVVGPGVTEENDEMWDQDEEGGWDEDAAEPQIQVTKSMYLDPEAEENEGSMAEEMARWSATLHLGPVTIGRATIFAFDDARNTDIWLPCDTHSDDLGRLAGAITGVGGLPRNRLFGYPLHEARNVAFVDRLTVDPDHRRQGLGRAFLWRTIETIFAAQPAVIAAYPFPIEARNAPGSEPWDLVRSFWTKAGFVHFNKGVYVAPYLRNPRWSFDAERDEELERWRRRVRSAAPEADADNANEEAYVDPGLVRRGRRYVEALRWQADVDVADLREVV